MKLIIDSEGFQFLSRNSLRLYLCQYQYYCSL